MQFFIASQTHGVVRNYPQSLGNVFEEPQSEAYSCNQAQCHAEPRYHGRLLPDLLFLAILHLQLLNFCLNAGVWFLQHLVHQWCNAVLNVRHLMADIKAEIARLREMLDRFELVGESLNTSLEADLLRIGIQVGIQLQSLSVQPSYFREIVTDLIWRAPVCFWASGHDHQIRTHVAPEHHDLGLDLFDASLPFVFQALLIAVPDQSKHQSDKKNRDYKR